ncbi:MAG: BamA/TamA family outer membrane protein [Bacteroidota bacterium]
MSKTQRFETGINYSRFHFRQDVQSYYYDNIGNLLLVGDREKQDNAPPGFNLYNGSLAYVSDNSVFGLTAPLAGHRFRIGIEQYFGIADFTAATIDYRKYQRLKPISLAFRALHYARFGAGANALPTLFAGDPSFVRGYHFNAINQTLQENNLSFNQLTGNKLLVTNFEIRLPFTGPEGLAAVKSKLLFSDLALFFDAGIAFDQYRELLGDDSIPSSQSAKPVLSTGVSMRINLFGVLILEPYYALPLQQNTRGVFGINILPGW